ncbi:uncharacterized protein Gasu_64420 [Galdieria sulphuraria]|uniref:LYR motif-containing protein 5 n=1 Tax=Galdieria sulphuraria TaxID=130081 RepID=M2XR54_GALSU|nr:uncharacterized protein Gasu_64420 [Galdieria sulphuraria]EME25899.1 hypothetical protein Gasu_64420 [Galdieria sulphuraria]|eukprot:XP_005702419.1 hypothetical protein Gasu_64420 [Galdieria sulphuraria]
MDYRVRLLYKRFLLVGRQYPEPFGIVREKIKRGFQANSTNCDKPSIERALEHGEFVLKEAQALVSLHKYRTLNKRYGRNSDEF